LNFFSIAVAVGLAWGFCGSLARAQAPATAPEPPTLPEALPAPDATQISPAILLERLTKMEASLNQLREQNQELRQKYDDISRELERSKLKVVPRPTAGATDPDFFDSLGIGDEPDNSASITGHRPRTQDEGGFTRDFDEQEVGNRREGQIPLVGRYSYGREGIQFESEDGEFYLKFRYLLQADARYFSPGNEKPVTDGFYFPRGRLYFDGRVTKQFEYQISFQQAYDSFNLLNAFLHYNYDQRLQFRIGRFKTPYTYEFYKINVWDLYAPERSVFNVNFALNRQLGAALSGELFDERVEYAIGAFNGQRNSYQPYTNTPDVIGLVNFEPFEHVPANSWLSVLTNLNVGGSGSFGVENNPLTPAVLRTSANASSAGLDSPSAYNSANVPFLAFNPNVRERGPRALGELHLAYFYQGLSLLAAWDFGFESWAFGTGGPSPVRVPLSGYFVQAAYLITGETRSETGQIDPIHRFDLRPGRFGLGALEPTARFSELSLGKQVFSGGLADPNLWTNQVSLVDVGMNWYLNKYVKIYLDWEYAIFGSPVYYSPDHLSKTNSTYWARFQVYY
jgi:phosphate-selective porin OprO/OprP